ncbi:VOC family protein [Nocardioides sp. LHD-245]|uniref:VOC family protein n=1 Tax=Nocardioides sp. LHD-245 TaxID=3051387 RepID=UPI0027E106A6|nr:VOC family protein [Nocardioides sp. LHD-245]
MSTSPSTPVIGHVGVVVADLERSLPRWSAALGYRFSPVARYRCDTYYDSSGPDPHRYERRITMSREGAPHVELMEALPGEPVGVHHLGFTGIADLAAQHRVLAEAGVDWDGHAVAATGDLLLWFTEPGALDGVRLEYVGTRDQPLLTDAGDRLATPSHGALLWPEGAPAPSGAQLVDEVEVATADVGDAATRWSRATGWRFATDAPSSDRRSTTDGGTRVVLAAPPPRSPELTGAFRLRFDSVADLPGKVSDLEAAGIGHYVVTGAPGEGPRLVSTDPVHLDGVTLTFVGSTA